MRELEAFLEQALVDLKVGEFLGQSVPAFRSHTIALFHQALEKTIKAFVKGLQTSRINFVSDEYGHAVEPFVIALTRVPGRNRSFQGTRSHLCKLFDPQTRELIRTLDGLVPRKPERADEQPRNTEYPFHLAPDIWTFPAHETAFSNHEFEVFREVVRRVVTNLRTISSSHKRKPKMK